MGGEEDPYAVDQGSDAPSSASEWSGSDSDRRGAQPLHEFETTYDCEDSNECVTQEAPALACAYCSRSIGDCYFFVNEKYTCAFCRELFGAATKVGSPPLRFLGATALGTLVAALAGGFCLWLMLSFGSPQGVSNLSFGFLAILTGYAVGTAVYIGCAKRGGWLYQLMAMGLTYCAIVTMFVPTVHRVIQEDQVVEAPSAESAPAGVKDHESLDQDGRFTAGESLPPWHEMDGVDRVLYCGLLYAVSFFGPIWTLAAVGDDWLNATFFLLAALAVGVAWYRNQRLEIVVTGPYEADVPER